MVSKKWCKIKSTPLRMLLRISRVQHSVYHRSEFTSQLMNVWVDFCFTDEETEDGEKGGPGFRQIAGSCQSENDHGGHDQDIS